MRPVKTPTYLKRVVKEKWDEVNRLRKRRVRWTIVGDRIEIDYEVGTNTAALPTVNALFHFIVSTLTTLVSPAEKTWIQQVVGSLLFYARALDLFVLTAVCQLSSHQSNPTQCER